MGHFIPRWHLEKIRKEEEEKAKQNVFVVTGLYSDTHSAFQALRDHPNFTFPSEVESIDPITIAKFVIDTIARFVSPTKVEGEDEEFTCKQVADAIRDHLGPEIISLLEQNHG